jgi:hypothetical protein
MNKMTKELIINRIKKDSGIDFIEFKKLENFNSENLSASIKTLDHLNDDQLKSLISDELIQSLFIKLVKSIRENGKFHFLDLRGTYDNNLTMFENEQKQNNKIMNYLLSFGNESSFITNGRISTELQDHQYNLVMLSVKDSIKAIKAIPYKIFSIYERDFFVDPFMRWTDDFILIIDKINLEIIDYEEKISNSPDIHYHLESNLKFKFELVNPKCLFVFTDEYQSNLYELISSVRNDKINSIIDF